MANSKTLCGITVPSDPECRHELLTPINQILGYTELLCEDAESSGQELLLSDLNKIMQAARQMAAQINALFVCSLKDDELSAPTAIPEKNQSLPAVLNKNLEGSPNNTITGCILVVDDNEANRDILCRRLERQGHQVVMSENGCRALEQIHEASFDLILLDVMMPGLDGYEVLRSIKSQKKLRHIPVVMISANTDMESIIKCIEMGAEDYLSKPFNPTLLKARIGAVLEKKRLREQEQHMIEQTMRFEAALERHGALTRAVAGVAHEINTPLGIANTGISIIENRFSLPKTQAQFKGDKENEELLQDILDSMCLIKKNVIRAHELVENFKKIAVNQVAENMETVSLPEVLKDAIDLYKLNALQAKLSFDLDDTGIRGSRKWHGYPGYLIQVLMNFFQNIERYAYPDGSGGKVDITLTDHEGEDRFILRVSDYGAGIDPENIGKIFDPFYTTGRCKGGTGLGLSIVNNIVTMALKGTIGVTSAPGQGTSFVIQFAKVLAD